MTKKQKFYHRKVTAPWTNDTGLTACLHVEEFKWIHIYYPEQKSSSSGSKPQHKTGYTKSNGTESGK